jgi:hypothetical protein
VISGDDLKVGDFEQARRDVWYTNHLHVRIDALGGAPVIVRLTKNRTEKVKCARPLRHQIEFGGAGERRRIVVTRRRGLVRNIEDMLHLLDLSGLSLRRRRVLVVVQKYAAELHAAPAQRIDVCLRARVGGGREPRFFFFIVVLLLPFLSTFLDLRASNGGSNGRAGRLRIEQISRPSGVTPLWVLVDVFKRDEGYVLRLSTACRERAVCAFAVVYLLTLWTRFRKILCDAKEALGKK